MAPRPGEERDEGRGGPSRPTPALSHLAPLCSGLLPKVLGAQVSSYRLEDAVLVECVRLNLASNDV